MSGDECHGRKTARTHGDLPYTAFSSGTAYSASNGTRSSTPSRRIALSHALLSSFFGTFVVASRST